MAIDVTDPSHVPAQALPRRLFLLTLKHPHFLMRKLSLGESSPGPRSYRNESAALGGNPVPSDSQNMLFPMHHGRIGLGVEHSTTGFTAGPGPQADPVSSHPETTLTNIINLGL